MFHHRGNACFWEFNPNIYHDDLYEIIACGFNPTWQKW
jgi:hypothetical protein